MSCGSGEVAIDGADVTQHLGTPLNAALPPIGAILIADYFRHKAEYLDEVRPTRPVNWGALTGVVAGGLVGWFVPWGIASINAMVVAVACYLGGEALAGRRGRELAPLS